MVDSFLKRNSDFNEFLDLYGERHRIPQTVLNFGRDRLPVSSYYRDVLGSNNSHYTTTSEVHEHGMGPLCLMATVYLKIWDGRTEGPAAFAVQQGFNISTEYMIRGGGLYTGQTEDFDHRDRHRERADKVLCLAHPRSAFEKDAIKMAHIAFTFSLMPEVVVNVSPYGQHYWAGINEGGQPILEWVQEQRLQDASFFNCYEDPIVNSPRQWGGPGVGGGVGRDGGAPTLPEGDSELVNLSADPLFAPSARTVNVRLMTLGADDMALGTRANIIRVLKNWRYSPESLYVGKTFAAVNVPLTVAENHLHLGAAPLAFLFVCKIMELHIDDVLSGMGPHQRTQQQVARFQPLIGTLDFIRPVIASASVATGNAGRMIYRGNTLAAPCGGARRVHVVDAREGRFNKTLTNYTPWVDRLHICTRDDWRVVMAEVAVGTGPLHGGFLYLDLKAIFFV
ncbi:hypothetical protein HK101_003077 [Irineochytrium annulatum]|nr:hypothetical protein HK101_003077 [Irineochytrium annulatum]